MEHKIAILGFNRSFSKEHRIRNEINIFQSCGTIDGYGVDTVDGIDKFYVFDRPNAILRRFIVLIGAIFPWIRIAFERRYYHQYAIQIRRNNYNFIIAHNIVDALVAIETGLPFLFHSHEYLPRQFDGDWLFRLTEIRYRRLALSQIMPTAVLTVVEGVKVARKYSADFGIPLDQFVVMPSMPRYHHFDDIASNNVQEREPRAIQLIHHGILAPVRGIELLVAIAKALGPSYQLTLMGPGPKEYLKALRSEALSALNITVRDPVCPEAIVSTVHEYDLGLVIFGSPHYHHKYMTVPNKFWECLQARVPVLVSPDSAMADIIRANGCGIVAEAATLEDYVTAIRSLTRQDILNLKKHCEGLARNHSRDSWMDSYRELVEQAVVNYFKTHDDGALCP